MERCDLKVQLEVYWDYKYSVWAEIGKDWLHESQPNERRVGHA